MSPFEILYLRRPRRPYYGERVKLSKLKQTWTEHFPEIELYQAVVMDRNKRLSNTKDYAKSSSKVKLKKNQLVLALQVPKKGECLKLFPYFNGPYRVLKSVYPNVYRVQCVNTGRRLIRHVRKLRLIGDSLEDDIKRKLKSNEKKSDSAVVTSTPATNSENVSRTLDDQNLPDQSELADSVRELSENVQNMSHSQTTTEVVPSPEVINSSSVPVRTNTDTVTFSDVLVAPSSTRPTVASSPSDEVTPVRPDSSLDSNTHTVTVTPSNRTIRGREIRKPLRFRD